MAAIFCNTIITLWSENGAVEKTRTSTSCDTATSTLRVYQFRHDRTVVEAEHVGLALVANRFQLNKPYRRLSQLFFVNAVETRPSCILLEIACEKVHIRRTHSERRQMFGAGNHNRI